MCDLICDVINCCVWSCDTDTTVLRICQNHDWKTRKKRENI